MTSPASSASPAGSLSSEDIHQIAERAKAQAQLVLQKVPVLGAVAWLMMQQTATRHTLLSELEWRVMPPLALDQARLFMKNDAPIAFVSWAKLSEPVAERYARLPHQLMPADWKSGDQNWLIDIITPFGGAREVMDELRKGVFAGQPVHQLVPSGGEGARTVVWEPLVTTPAGKP